MALTDDAAEHAVHKAGGVVGAVRLGDLDGLIDDDGGIEGIGHLEVQLVHGGAQQVAVGTGHALEAPIGGDGAQRGIDALAIGVHAARDLYRVICQRALGKREIAGKNVGHGLAADLRLEQDLKGLATGERTPAVDLKGCHALLLGETRLSMQMFTLSTSTPTWASMALTTASRTTSASFLNG